MITIPALILLTAVLSYLLFQKPSDPEVILTGLIPSLPNATSRKERGTKVLMYFGAQGGKVQQQRILINDFADEVGELRVLAGRDKIGEMVNCKITHPRYKFLDKRFKLQSYGAAIPIEMIEDDSYMGSAPGATVADLADHGNAALLKADEYRLSAFNRWRRQSLKLAEIPVLFWLVLYVLGVISFSIDYYIIGESFDKPIMDYADAIYLSAVTVTTLGYGDIVPCDKLAKLLTGLQASSGLVLMGLFLNSLFLERSPKAKSSD